MELTSRMKIARFQNFWIQINKRLNKSHKTGQTSGTKMTLCSIFNQSVRNVTMWVFFNSSSSASFCISVLFKPSLISENRFTTTNAPAAQSDIFLICCSLSLTVLLNSFITQLFSLNRDDSWRIT
ncbi:hypothetical protein Hanom_Chr03g00226131 [Helianthus anomalus]